MTTPLFQLVEEEVKVSQSRPPKTVDDGHLTHARRSSVGPEHIVVLPSDEATSKQDVQHGPSRRRPSGASCPDSL